MSTLPLASSAHNDTSSFPLKQEANKFRKAMSDSEFQNMLRDYMEEIQDPALRAVRYSYQHVANFII